MRKDILGRKIGNKTFVINTATKEVGYIVEGNRLRCISLVDTADYYQVYDKTVEDFSQWCGIRSDHVTAKQYECLVYNVFLDKKDDCCRKKGDDLAYKLYTKYRKIHLSVERKKILDYIKSSEKIILSEKDISLALGITYCNTDYALHYLEKDNLLNVYYNGFLSAYYFLPENKEKALELLK